jgi:membrane-associated protease RseP (regulator of RpoE activity)
MPWMPRVPQRPLSRSDKWIFWGLLLAVLGLLAAEVAIDYEPVKLSVLFFLLFWGPLLALHEAGHALMTAACGWRVRRVVIGYGRPVARFHVRGTPVEIRWIALEGFTQLAPTDARRPRLKHFLIYAAGPGIEALLLGLIVLVTGVDTLLTRTESVPVIAAQALAVAIVMGLVTNLVPHTAETASGASPNDGLGMLLSLGMTPEAVEARMRQEEEEGG